MTVTRFKSYPETKDSGIEWLGEIPAHWDIRRMKQMTGKTGSGKTPRGGAEAYVTEGIMLIRSQNVLTGALSLDNVVFIDEATDREMANTRVHEGDVLLNITGASLGRSCVARLQGHDANVNQHVCIIRPRSELTESRYLAYEVMSPAVQCQIFETQTGVSRDAVNFEQVDSLQVAKPPRREQQAIADFLDRETAKIDALVEKKERLIEVLQEKHSALITHAVIKGLDPDVPMKDSGIEWLGQIPAHWDVKKFSWLIKRSNAGEVIDRGYWGGGDELLYSCQRTPIWSTFERFPSERRTQSGDLLVTRNGTPYVHLPEPGSIYTNVVQRVQMTGETTTRFAHTVLSTAASTLIGFGDIIESFNMGTWRQLWLPIPPMDEQAQITRILDRETAKIDALIAKVQEAIERLKEYRTALISAAVTGKIDVREAVQ